MEEIMEQIEKDIQILKDTHPCYEKAPGELISIIRNYKINKVLGNEEDQTQLELFNYLWKYYIDLQMGSECF